MSGLLRRSSRRGEGFRLSPYMVTKLNICESVLLFSAHQWAALDGFFHLQGLSSGQLSELRIIG